MVSVFLMWLLVKKYPVANILHILENINWLLVLGGLLAQAALYFLIGVRWKYLFCDYSLISSINGSAIAVAANSLVPLRIGELFRAIYLKKCNQIDKTKTIARIIVERGLDAILILSSLLLSIIALGDILGNKAKLVFLVGSIIIITFISLLGLYVKFSHRVNPVLRLFTENIFRLPRIIISKIESFLDVFKNLPVKRIVISLLLTSIILISGMLSLWFFLNACKINIPFFKVLLIFPLVTLSISIPMTVGHVGIYHAAMVFSLTLVGFVGQSVMSQVIVVHLFFTIPTVLYGWGLISLNHIIKNMD